ncbi:hypothetical protein EVAR_100118_1 [Eumeta japonica]|uniref:Uncharacterized protein n=1 Tax=Eumeta variegata TaxID=151549 RepID=A0A4C2AEY4_EUMVA|nr:hypothetical protein EVAR_100118_1 [Eumeta japonica]
MHSLFYDVIEVNSVRKIHRRIKSSRSSSPEYAGTTAGGGGRGAPSRRLRRADCEVSAAHFRLDAAKSLNRYFLNKNVRMGGTLNPPIFLRFISKVSSDFLKLAILISLRITTEKGGRPAAVHNDMSIARAPPSALLMWAR